MENDFQKPMFSRALMTAVFVGYFTTLLTLIYDLIFVQMLKFPFSTFINVATLIFSVNLIFVVIGFIYYGFLSAFKKGDLYFIIVFILLSIFFVWRAEGIERTDNYTVNIQFRNLLSGIIIIIGAAASLVIPLLFHNKKFEKYVL